MIWSIRRFSPSSWEYINLAVKYLAYYINTNPIINLCVEFQVYISSALTWLCAVDLISFCKLYPFPWRFVSECLRICACLVLVISIYISINSIQFNSVMRCSAVRFSINMIQNMIFNFASSLLGHHPIVPVRALKMKEHQRTLITYASRNYWVPNCQSCSTGKDNLMTACLKVWTRSSAALFVAGW